ncbi:phosphate signaling complex protein PhoU [Lentilactobacillus kribbianus]|uniref:phosphate signaling complex protein PhoU n=1 Tax=Lentilactobacillus kribbianus TaxID=2729622 RepID=UPI0015541BCB|nr:phosphate signaling complex protein PhoU [Lentilactobacillus kribbianus]
MTILEQKVTTLTSQFAEMGALAIEATMNAGRSFVNHDVELANRVIVNDTQINELQLKLEKQSFEIMALYQPVATDLRQVVGVLKAVTDVERIGDHARNIAHRTIKFAQLQRIPEIERNIWQMVEEVSAELRIAMDAYNQADLSQARTIPTTYNGPINDLYNEIASASYQAVADDPTLINTSIGYLKIAQDLGRISDYGINIAEWSIYLATGKLIELDNY